MFVVSFSACTNIQASNEERETVIFSDDKGIKDEVVITENDIKDVNRQIADVEQNLQDTVTRGADDSEIVTMYDSLGNKTETRRFKGHPRLRFLILKTSTDGQRQVFVYGYSEDVKTLTGEIANNVLATPGDEIANAAGLYENRSYKETTNFMKPAKPLQPLPSSSFPIQTLPNVQPPSVESEQNTEIQPEENSPDPVKKEEAGAIDRHLDEEK